MTKLEEIMAALRKEFEAFRIVIGGAKPHPIVTLSGQLLDEVQGLISLATVGPMGLVQYAQKVIHEAELAKMTVDRDERRAMAGELDIELTRVRTDRDIAIRRAMSAEAERDKLGRRLDFEASISATLRRDVAGLRAELSAANAATAELIRLTDFDLLKAKLAATEEALASLRDESCKLAAERDALRGEQATRAQLLRECQMRNARLNRRVLEYQRMEKRCKAEAETLRQAVIVGFPPGTRLTIELPH